MNPLVAQMTGRRIQEDDGVPVPAVRRSTVPPRRQHDRQRRLQRRTVAAMMGMAETKEDEESIIPGDAEEVDNYGGPEGFRGDPDKEAEDKEPEPVLTPDSTGGDGEAQLITPKAALVAPDVTPRTLEPIDPSDVPAPAQASPKPAAAADGPGAARPASTVDPMDVLLGRKSGAQSLPPEEKANAPVTAEAAQATVNTVLGVNGPGDLLGQGKEMPPPSSGDAKKIMEAFYRFGRPH